jgi:hypothetical protein
MAERAEFLIEYARLHGPVTVRQLYYAAEVAGLPGIEKDEAGYARIQRQVLALRRDGRMPYDRIADATRWMRKPRSYDGLADALEATAAFYRRSLWADRDDRVEVWLEKDALAGVVLPITALFDVPLMVTRGYSSETFAWEAVRAAASSGARSLVIYILADFDRSGQDAARSLREKLGRFGQEHGLEIAFEQLGVTVEQIRDMRLSTRPPKRSAPADRAWPHAFACELDAIPPDTLRDLVEGALLRHISPAALRAAQVIEASERQILSAFAAKEAR